MRFRNGHLQHLFIKKHILNCIMSLNVITLFLDVGIFSLPVVVLKHTAYLWICIASQDMDILSRFRFFILCHLIISCGIRRSPAHLTCHLVIWYDSAASTYYSWYNFVFWGPGLFSLNVAL